MAVPSIIYDGDLTVATQDGPGWFTLPFQDRGDTQSWEWHINVTQRADVFRSIQQQLLFTPGFVPSIERMGTAETLRGTGYLTGIGEPTEINNTGLLRYQLTYSGLPRTRYEGTSVVYSIQFYSTDPGYDWENPPAAPEVAEFPLACKGWNKFEYFVNFYPEVIHAPKITAVFNTLLKVNWPPDFNKPVVAKDSEIGIWKGGIIERKTLYAVVELPTA